MVTILVAEDISRQRTLIESLLSDYCTSIRCASDGDEAIRLANVYNPDIVIMDLNMPSTDGYQAMERIKSIDSEIKVIVSTAYTSEQSVAKATEMGADDYLVKPYTKQEVIDSIESVLE